MMAGGQFDREAPEEISILLNPTVREIIKLSIDGSKERLCATDYEDSVIAIEEMEFRPYRFSILDLIQAARNNYVILDSNIGDYAGLISGFKWGKEKGLLVRIKEKNDLLTYVHEMLHVSSGLNIWDNLTYSPFLDKYSEPELYLFKEHSPDIYSGEDARKCWEGNERAVSIVSKMIFDRFPRVVEDMRAASLDFMLRYVQKSFPELLGNKEALEKLRENYELTIGQGYREFTEDVIFRQFFYDDFEEALMKPKPRADDRDQKYLFPCVKKPAARGDLR